MNLEVSLLDFALLVIDADGPGRPDDHVLFFIKCIYEGTGTFSGLDIDLQSQNLLSRFVPIFFLSALRDASQEFGQRGQFWSGF